MGGTLIIVQVRSALAGVILLLLAFLNPFRTMGPMDGLWLRLFACGQQCKASYRHLDSYALWSPSPLFLAEDCQRLNTTALEC